MRKAGCQAPRTRIKTARQVVNLARRLVGHGVVIFHLVAGFRHARTRDRPHVVIPPVDTFARLAVIRRPAKVGGVDIGGQAFLEPVQLIGADEMHLARQAGLIARTPQMVGVGGHARRELCRVVIDARGRRELPRHERRPPRRAQRAGGIGVLEPRRPRRQLFEVRGMQPLGGAVGKQRAVQLVNHQDQDIGLGHTAVPTSI